MSNYRFRYDVALTAREHTETCEVSYDAVMKTLNKLTKLGLAEKRVKKLKSGVKATFLIQYIDLHEAHKAANRGKRGHSLNNADEFGFINELDKLIHCRKA